MDKEPETAVMFYNKYNRSVTFEGHVSVSPGTRGGTKTGSTIRLCFFTSVCFILKNLLREGRLQCPTVLNILSVAKASGMVRNYPCLFARSLGRRKMISLLGVRLRRLR